MNIRNAELAKRYAMAFLNLYIDKFDEKSLFELKQIIEFLENNSNIVSFFSLPNISLRDKAKEVDILFSKFNLPNQLNQLAILLVKHGRASLLVKVLNKIILIYQQRMGNILFEITSAVPLMNNDLMLVRKFLEEKTGKKVIESYKVDKNLIAGIRAQSDNLLWERSISRQFQNVNRLLV